MVYPDRVFFPCSLVFRGMSLRTGFCWLCIKHREVFIQLLEHSKPRCLESLESIFILVKNSANSTIFLPVINKKLKVRRRIRVWTRVGSFGLGREDLGRILVAFQLLVSDTAILAVTFCSAHRSQEFHALVLPRLDESISELVHHCLVVLGSRSDTQAFFSTLHCGIVD